MTDRLAEIEARLDAATPGPWTHYAPPFVRIVAPEIPPDVQRMVGPDPHNPVRAFGDRICEVESEGFDDEANADLIAAAPTDLRDLVAVAKAAIKAAPWVECVGDHETCEQDPCPGCQVRHQLAAALRALANLEGGA